MQNLFFLRTSTIGPELTSDYELGREVGDGGGVGGPAGVAAAVGGRQAEEENVAAEDIILDLNILTSREVFPVFVPLNVDGHVAGGYRAGHLRSVSLLQISIECEGRYFGRLDGLQVDVTRGRVAVAVVDGAGVDLAVGLLHSLQHEGPVTEGLGPGSGHQSLVDPPLDPGDGVPGHRAHQQHVLPHHGRHVDHPATDGLPCKVFRVTGPLRSLLISLT